MTKKMKCCEYGSRSKHKRPSLMFVGSLSDRDILGFIQFFVGRLYELTLMAYFCVSSKSGHSIPSLMFLGRLQEQGLVTQYSVCRQPPRVGTYDLVQCLQVGSRYRHLQHGLVFVPSLQKRDSSDPTQCLWVVSRNNHKLIKGLWVGSRLLQSK